MNKTNKKSINLGLKILAILVLALIFMPLEKVAANGWTAGNNSTYSIDQQIEAISNPAPTVTSINPKSSNLGVGTKTVTITGNSFVPGSIARINGSSRSATFIDNSHLLVQITGNDTYTYRTNGGFFISVFNGAPGGGYSNAAFFTVNDTGTTPAINNSGNYTSTDTNNSANNIVTPDNFTDTPANQTNTGTVNGANDSYSNLASNAIFGSNSFLPSGLVQWVLFAIIILLIVIIVRKIFGHEKAYHEAPMKHA